MTRPFPDTGRGTFAISAKDELLKFARAFDIIAIGPGLGREEGTIRLVLGLLSNLDKPLVIDADALFAIAQDKSVLKKIRTEAVLSPHPGEMSRLTGKTVAAIQKERLKTAADFAREHKVILVLKGYKTVVTDEAKYYINPTGNPGMATAGSGDVLTGAVAAFLAQGLSAFDAAQLGVYIHGLAGDLAAEEKGQISLIAEDILDKLPQATMRISQPHHAGGP
jgi:NAD(P)H-hydrate epimerase